MLCFSAQEWQMLDDGGLETHDLPPSEVKEAIAIRAAYPRLSANDCFCLAAAKAQDDGILLSGDGLLRRAAKESSTRVHGVLWIIDELKSHSLCSDELLVSALEAWRADSAVFLPPNEIQIRIEKFAQ